MIGLPLALLAVLTGSLTGYLLADPRQARRDITAFLALAARALANVTRRWTA